MSNTNIHITVSTGKKTNALRWSAIDHTLFVETRSRPIEGRANSDILKTLKKLFKTETYLVSGLTSKHKVVGIATTQEQVEEILRTLPVHVRK